MTQFGSYSEALAILRSQRAAEFNPWCKDALDRAIYRLERELQNEIQLFEAFSNPIIPLSPDMEIH